MAKEAGEKKKTSIWLAVTIIAVTVTGIIGAGVYIYWEQLFPESHKKMTRAVTDVAKGAKAMAKSRFNDLLTKASQFDFKAKGLPLCQEAEAQSVTPKGWHYRELTSVLGLPSHPTRKAILKRCQAYAKAIRAMQHISGPKASYEVTCADQGTHFEIDARRGLGIFPLAKGVRQNVIGTMPAKISVRKGETRLLQSWQVYGLGRGCYVIGSDKVSAFQRSGKVTKDKEAKK